ncbi:MAG: ATP-dependent DNA helicase RecG [Acidobacteria bacterium]|nr:ATP-dependent DNA helicase RecG [Acidobacteriota bacterium]
MSQRSPTLNPQVLRPDTPVQYVKGVGPRRAEQFAQEGIHTVEELLCYLPFRYEDRTQYRPLASLREDEWALTRGRICSVSGFETRKRRMSVLEVLVRDATGSMRLKFFNQPYLRSLYKPGLHLIIYGQVKRDAYSGTSLVFMNPECEVHEEEVQSTVHSGRIVPVYRKLGTMRTRTLRQIMYGITTQLPADMTDPLPEYLRRQYRFLPRNRALAQVHFPELGDSNRELREREMRLLNSGLSPAHKRLIFEELFQLQVGLHMIRSTRARVTKDRQVQITEPVRQSIKKILPFHPTAAQKRVLREIADDIRSPRPMSRLLQGDVGSGKTIVAAQAAIIVVENGYQVAFMAPTEILAEQHHYNLRRLLSPVGYPIDLLKGGLRERERREALERIRAGQTKIAVGTHSLIQEGVEFSRLALAIVDEQHRFGVVQRRILMEKGHNPDVLVMTATPIPRSLALTLYGDLDVSVIDELPPGRKPIETRWYEQEQREKAYEEIRRTVTAGHQAYVVYPLVEGSERSDLRAATEMAEHLQVKVFPRFRIGLLHGRMKDREKELVMSYFAAGELQVLVSTTVIEVGIDVPNATLMVVEHAERFGLSQLHQLRGRVGRGAAQSVCLLIADVRDNPEARRRLEVMCETNDGFRIAEVDLELRGPGEVIGTRQSGMPAFRFADLVRDRRALELASEEAKNFLARLRAGGDEECRQIASLIRQTLAGRYGWALVG